MMWTTILTSLAKLVNTAMYKYYMDIIHITTFSSIKRLLLATYCLVVCLFGVHIISYLYLISLNSPITVIIRHDFF